MLGPCERTESKNLGSFWVSFFFLFINLFKFVIICQKVLIFRVFS